jgi:hypothetical protein
LPDFDALTNVVDVPEPVMLVGAVVAVRPIDGLRIRLTVPLNPFSVMIVIVELAAAPARIVMVVGLAATTKSITWTLTVIVCVRVPLELMMVAV